MLAEFISRPYIKTLIIIGVIKQALDMTVLTFVVILTSL